MNCMASRERPHSNSDHVPMYARPGKDNKNGAAAFSIMPLSKLALSNRTFSKLALSIMILSKLALNIMILS